jgi:hypothetical protein
MFVRGENTQRENKKVALSVKEYFKPVFKK